MSDTETEAPEQQVDRPLEPADHPAASRRQRLRELDEFFKPVAVPPATQQSESMLTIRERAKILAQIIEERCPHGPEKVLAIRKAQEAMFWAMQAISHR